MRTQNDWRVLTPEQVELLAAGQRSRAYGSGEPLFTMGAVSRGVYCVCSGTVAVRRLDAHGNSVLLQLAYPGDTLGYTAFLTGEPHTTAAEAVGPTTVCLIDKSTVGALLEDNPALGLQFLRRTADHLDEAQDRLVQNATLSNRAKFAHLLLVLMDRFGQRHGDGARTMDLPVSRRDLASMIGTRHETLSRIITRMEEDGVAQFSGRSVHVPQIDSLLEEIQPHLVG